MPSVTITTPIDTASQLHMHGISPDCIDAIIFSHWHFDHLGDPTLFPHSRLIVGPGFKEHCLPGYPHSHESMIPNEAFENRKIDELSFNGQLKIASLEAIDYFGDGSFYLLSTPGHAVGHISALARTMRGRIPSEDTFVLLAGDVCHHAGALRPSKSLPIALPPGSHEELDSRYKTIQEYQAIHPCRSCTEPFYEAAPGGFNLDARQMRETVEKIAILDGDERIFVLLAHDHWLLDVVDLFPARVNDWKSQSWADKARWRFLLDFE